MEDENNLYRKYKIDIQVSRQVHRMLKNLKKEKETFNDVLENILIKEGYL